MARSGHVCVQSDHHNGLIGDPQIGKRGNCKRYASLMDDHPTRDASLTASLTGGAARSPSSMSGRPSTAGSVVTEVTEVTVATEVTEVTEGEPEATETETETETEAETAAEAEPVDPPVASSDDRPEDSACEAEAKTTSQDPTQLAHAAKARQIRDACVRSDFAELEKLAVSDGGFLTDELRQLAWPVLLGIPLSEDGGVNTREAEEKAGIAADEEADAWKSMPQHRDEEQVQLDVNRAFVHYPTHASSAEEERQRAALSDLIVEVLRRQPFLCYFQGFHDICQVLLLVLPPPLRTPAVLRLAILRIRDFLLPTIDAAVQQLLLLPDILRLADPPLWSHLRLAQHPRPFFALSGTLTMYAHDMRSLGAVARVFDVLLARSPSFSLYLFAAIVCAHRAALFDTPADEPEMLHHILSKLPGKAGGEEGIASSDAIESLDALVRDASSLNDRFPPAALPAWRAVARASVLKTAQDAATAAAQTTADGERLFYEHVRELARADRRRLRRERLRLFLRQYRGPLCAAGVAVLVGTLAIWLQRTNSFGNSGSGTFYTTDWINDFLGTRLPPARWDGDLGGTLSAVATSVLSRLGIAIA